MCGVRTDRPDGDLTARVVIACDGVNSFIAKEAGLYGPVDAANYTLGVKETIALPKDVIDERFGVRGRQGVDIEILGGTSGVNGGGFVYTNLDTVAVGVVLKLPKLAAQQRRPEDIIAHLKRHSAIAPLIEGGELKEYSAHLIPEAGLSMMPKLAGDGLLVAGDAAALCLAAGIWLEGVNFAMASGMAAGQAAAEAITRGDTSVGRSGRVRAAAQRHVRAARPSQAAPRTRAGAERPSAAHVPGDDRRHRAGDVPGREPQPQAGPPAHRRPRTQARRRSPARPAARHHHGIEDVRMRRRPTPHVADHIEPDPAWSAISFQDRMATAVFEVHERAHIVVDGSVCTDCSTRDCVVACPANLFVPTSDGGIVFNYEQCFECGTCYLVCNREGAISWSYPDGGHGVVFRHT